MTQAGTELSIVRYTNWQLLANDHDLECNRKMRWDQNNEGYNEKSENKWCRIGQIFSDQLLKINNSASL